MNDKRCHLTHTLHVSDHPGCPRNRSQKPISKGVKLSQTTSDNSPNNISKIMENK